ncbi:MAG: YHS domain-containing protein [Chromatiales bacterium]
MARPSRGYDPVAYFKEQKPVKGPPEYKAEYKGLVFFFTSQGNRDACAANPARYAPQYAAQRDMLKIRLADLTSDGLLVTQAKTGTRLLYEWTPELRVTIDQTMRLPRSIRDCVYCVQSLYSERVPSIWQRVMKKAVALGRMLRSVLLHRGLRHVNPELTEFPDETRKRPTQC